jgi:heptosyltransferase-2
MRVAGRRTIDRSGIKRVLVHATSWIGDIVMGLPALEAVRENFRTSTVVVLARPWVIPLIENHPAVNQVVPLRKGRGYLTDLVEFIRVAAVIRRMRFDLAILFQNAFAAALLAYLGDVRFRIGYNTDGRRLLLSHAVIRDDAILERHQVEYYLSILRAMGWEAHSKNPELYVDETDMASIQSLLSSKGVEQDDFLLGLNPGAIYGPAKRWPPDRFAAIGDWAAERWGAKVIVMGSNRENDICALVTQSMRHAPLNLCGRTTLGEAMALIKSCNFFVTNDSGLMHVAAALKRPMVAIFGSTDSVVTGPRSNKAEIVQHDIACSPCLKSECPTDFHCMLDIEPDEVWKEMEILRGKLA